MPKFNQGSLRHSQVPCERQTSGDLPNEIAIKFVGSLTRWTDSRTLCVKASKEKKIAPSPSASFTSGLTSSEPPAVNGAECGQPTSAAVHVKCGLTHRMGQAD